MRKYSFLFVFVVIAEILAAQSVKISGLAEDYRGKQAILFRDADPISGKREVIQIADIDEKGNFSIEYKTSDTEAVRLSISRTEGLLYVEPGKTYKIIFPAQSAVEAKRFDRSEVALDLSQLPEDDLNLLIRQFNSDYISFIRNHYYDFAVEEFKGSSVYRSSLGEKMTKSDIYKMPSEETKDEEEFLSDFPMVVARFLRDMEAKYSADFSNRYFNDYVRYALAEIKLLSGLNRKRFYREYFDKQALLYRNTAYMKVFSTFYTDLFKQDTNANIDSLDRYINRLSNVQRLSDFYKKDSIADDDELRMLATLLNLKNNFYNKEYAKQAILKTIQSTNESAATPYQKQIAKNIEERLTQYSKGYPFEDFLVGDAREEKWRLSEHIDRPTYLYFFTTWSAASLKEMMMLEKLYSLYKYDIQFIAVCMDDDYESFKKYLREHKSQKFKIVYGAGDPLMSDKYNVRSIPHAVMLDIDGKWMYSHTRRPGEGVEEDFKQVKSANAKPSEGRKTWKDRE